MPLSASDKLLGYTVRQTQRGPLTIQPASAAKNATTLPLFRPIRVSRLSLSKPSVARIPRNRAIGKLVALTLNFGVAVENVVVSGAVLQQLVQQVAEMKASLALLLKQQTVREFYTVKQVAEMLGKKEYTVREWCRLGRLAAKKLPGGRGNEGEWRIPHEELERYQNEGLLPLSPQALWR